MRVESEKDFKILRERFNQWRKQFPMFVHDVNRIEHAVEDYIQNYSIALVHYRQSKKKNHLEKAQQQIDKINSLIDTIEKIELMALLSRG